jgi:hypothetical protein
VVVTSTGILARTAGVVVTSTGILARIAGDIPTIYGKAKKKAVSFETAFIFSF